MTHILDQQIHDTAVQKKTSCAICYSAELCVDDGEAYICVDRDACKKRVDEAAAWRNERTRRYSPMPFDPEDDEEWSDPPVSEPGTCDGWPQMGCSNDATEDMLGHKLCIECARRFVRGANTPPTITPIPTPTPLEETRCSICNSTSHPATRCPDVAAVNAAMDEAAGCVQPLRELGRVKDALAELMDMGEWVLSQADDCTLYTIHLRAEHYDEVMALLNNDRRSSLED